MKKTFAIIVFLLVCLTHTAGLGFATFGEASQLETRNSQLETDSSEPLGLEGGFNLYEYGLSNPMMYIDPLGLCAQSTSSELYWTQGRDSYELTPAQQRENWRWEMGWPTGSVFDPTIGEMAWKIAKGVVNIWLLNFDTTTPEGQGMAMAAMAAVGGGLNVIPAATAARTAPLAQSVRYSGDQAALIDLVKQAQRTGTSPANAQTLLQWGKEYNVTPALNHTVPPLHWNNTPHIRIGSVNHIMVTQ